MNKSKYNEITIPDNIDSRIDEGIKNASLEKIKITYVKRIEQLKLLQLV